MWRRSMPVGPSRDRRRRIEGAPAVRWWRHLAPLRGEEAVMAPLNHQTVRLGRGKHESPAHGVCVIELASMLAHEPFSDHPASVCPIIGAFLRSYNDCIDSRRRQDLYPYAARIVGSRVPKRFQLER